MVPDGTCGQKKCNLKPIFKFNNVFHTELTLILFWTGIHYLFNFLGDISKYCTGLPVLCLVDLSTFKQISHCKGYKQKSATGGVL